MKERMKAFKMRVENQTEANRDGEGGRGGGGGEIVRGAGIDAGIQNEKRT